MLGFNLSEEIPNFTNHDVSERNMRCEICIIEMWYDMSKIIWGIEIITFSCESLKQTWHKFQRRNI